MQGGDEKAFGEDVDVSASIDVRLLFAKRTPERKGGSTDRLEYVCRYLFTLARACLELTTNIDDHSVYHPRGRRSDAAIVVLQPTSHPVNSKCCL